MKISCFIIGFVFAFQAGANVRVIGNGGGDAEMRALTQFSAIAEVLHLVADSKTQRFLSLSVQQELANLLTSPERDQWTVDFSNDISEMFELNSESRRVVLNLKTIEDRHFRLDHVLVHAYLNIPPNATVSQILTVEERVFPDTRWELQIFKNHNTRFLVFENTSGLLSGIEDGDDLVDTGDLIQSESGCAKSEFLLTTTGNISVKRSGYFLMAHWRCGSQQFRGQAQLSKKAEDGWQAVLFGVRAL